MKKMEFILCPFCEEEHELEVVESKNNGDAWWVRYLCNKTEKSFTRYGAFYISKI